MPRRGPAFFKWTGEPDNTSTHLSLEKGKVYPVSAVSLSILLDWLDKGKIYLVEGEFNEGTVLEVQDGTLGASSEFEN